MANNPYNHYTNPGNLLDTDIFCFSRSPHTGGTFFKTTFLNIQTYLSGSGVYLLKANNLSDVASATTSATNLGLGTTSNVAFNDITANRDLNVIRHVTANADLTVTGMLTANNASFNAGRSGFNIGGSNPACNVGTNCNLGYSSGPGQYFTNDVGGDVCLRQASTSNTLRLGAGSSNGSSLDITNTQCTFNVPVNGITVSLSGDVTGTTAATVVSLVGGSTSALVHSAELLANAATSANTASTIVLRDSSGNFLASGATFSAGVSGFNITGTNAACNVGTNGKLGQASSTGQFLSNSATGDVCLATATSTALRLGISGSNSLLDVASTAITARTTLNYPGGGTSRMLFLDSSSNVTANASYTVNGTGGLTIAQTLTAAGGSFSAGVSNFSITGSNAAINIGADVIISQASSGGSFFNNSTVNDCIAKTTSTSASVRIGSGNANAQLSVSNTQISTTVGILLPTSGGTATSLDYYEETTLSTNYTGAISGGPITLVIKRIGTIVHIYVPAFGPTTAGSSSNISTVTALPSRFISSNPSIALASISVINNGLGAIGTSSVNSSGILVFGGGAGGSNFTSGGSTSVYAHTLVYVL